MHAQLSFVWPYSQSEEAEFRLSSPHAGGPN